MSVLACRAEQAGAERPAVRPSALKRRKLAEIARLLGPTDGLRCLDLGADSGVVSYLLRQRGGAWTSADIDDEAVASIRRLVGDHVVRVHGAGPLPFDTDAFDRVVVVDLLEHLHDDDAFVGELFRIIRPGGELIVNVPHHRRTLLRGLRVRLGDTDDKHGHVRPGYTRRTLRELLVARFEVVVERTYNKAASELLDIAQRVATARVKKGRPGSAKGVFLVEKDFQQGRRVRALRALAEPLTGWLPALDHLFVGADGYMLIVRARSLKLKPRPTDRASSAARGQQHAFTVFTPTYNRAATLPRVYASLTAQTFRDFEWLIGDDGSSDGTRELVERWMREASFPIRYFWQPNRGKHVTYNEGVRRAQGELFLTLDSDDACVPHALERFKRIWDDIPEADRGGFSAVTALCVDQHGQLVGDRFPRDPTDSDSLEIRYRYKVRGEKWGFQRTAVLREFPFPEPEGARHVPPSVAWSAIAGRYKTRYVNEMLRIYYVDERADRLSRGQARVRNARGLALWHGTVLCRHLRWLPAAPIRFAGSAVNYVRYSLHDRVGVAAAIRRLDVPGARLLAVLALPVGVAVYVRDRASARRAARAKEQS
jgi:glycosyltransferase involved in cell wall biosynthesis/SAM-dependent methyltransferase